MSRAPTGLRKIPPANALSVLRILCALLLWASPVFSPWYIGWYLLGGLTDLIDGPIARRTKTASEGGAKLDTAADAVFLLSVLVKLWSALIVPRALLLWIGCILLLKILSALLGVIRYHRFLPVHSCFNKLCGGVTFFTLLLLGANGAWQGKAIAVIFTCALATVAAVHECILILTGKAL